ncbi:hypothetical protein Lesp02_82330 [Lentzea sp. NBRC 105346]|uniref:hypothetical protein n=1 Tax=Lentzea sp. NBRC 105346 TaxID=3032205 RepID=UPI0024A19510|nr:hypothetical protein [Lentzea sp. NBRC 105346]GLZ36046.1 hypothetical protein Lesp02_82330 [Lentzea sp. NBRC 105346]
MHRNKFLLAFATATLMSAATPAAAQIQIQTLNNVVGTANGTVFPSTTATGAPLLTAFRYFFIDSDHHIRKIAAVPLPQQSAVEVAFADENGDDRYSYGVAHQWVDPTGITQHSLHGGCAGRCSVQLFTRPPGNFEFVLTGFRVTFENGDHHLDELGITESGGVLTTVYKDENGDDPFTYDVGYAWVPTTRLAAVDEVGGLVHAKGSVVRDAIQGDKVIRGFFVDNSATGGQGKDNHIRDLGVSTGQFNIFVNYGDDNPADSADWRYRVKYAVLR